MPESDDISLPPKWQSAVDTINDLIDGGEAMLLARGLPEGPGSKVGIERLAREFLKATPESDLGIIYAILGVTTSVAAQGAYVLLVPKLSGGWLDVPAIQMVLGIAPSGWGKTTALGLGMTPLERALGYGISERRSLLPRLRQKAVDDFTATQAGLVAPLVPDDKQFKEVYDGGLCTKTLTVDPTQEALRNQIVRNGGIGGVIAGEADIFRSLVAYSIVPGSLSLFLNGWDQGEINTTRVSDMDLHMKNAALSVCVLFQPEVFAEVTSGNVKATGSSADSFMARGMFGRFFTVETENVTDYLAMAAAYSDDNDFDNDPNDPNGYSTADGKITPLGSAAIDFDLALQDLVQDSNEYRMKTAIYQAWTAAENRYGTDLQVLEPEKPMRHSLHLEDPESRIAYRRCQKMMALVRAHIQQSDDPDTRTLWEPMASRLVQHALREALIMTLAAGRKSSPTDPLVKEPFHVTAEFIEDAATRILPWRMCMSANALTRRATERAEDVLAQAVTVTNPKMRDLTPSAMIRDLLFDLAADDRNLALSGMTKTEIHKRLQSRLPRGSARTSVSKLLTSALEELSADPTTGIAQVPGKPNALGKTGVRYTVRVPTNF